MRVSDVETIDEIDVYLKCVLVCLCVSMLLSSSRKSAVDVNSKRGRNKVSCEWTIRFIYRYWTNIPFHVYGTQQTSIASICNLWHKIASNFMFYWLLCIIYVIACQLSDVCHTYPETNKVYFATRERACDRSTKMILMLNVSLKWYRRR